MFHTERSKLSHPPLMTANKLVVALIRLLHSQNTVA